MASHIRKGEGNRMTADQTDKIFEVVKKELKRESVFFNHLDLGGLALIYRHCGERMRKVIVYKVTCAKHPKQRGEHLGNALVCPCCLKVRFNNKLWHLSYRYGKVLLPVG